MIWKPFSLYFCLIFLEIQEQKNLFFIIYCIYLLKCIRVEKHYFKYCTSTNAILHSPIGVYVHVCMYV
jgi:hypothetical protein